jgi:hypothetical protein
LRQPSYAASASRYVPASLAGGCGRSPVIKRKNAHAGFQSAEQDRVDG